MIWSAIKAVLSALFSATLGRFFARPNPEVEATHEALDAKTAEAKALARPDSPWPDTVKRL